MNNIYRAGRTVIAFAIACLISFVAGMTQVLAQSSSSLSGRITDSQEAAVPGAIVTLYARATHSI
jgi:hypothetical protein